MMPEKLKELENHCTKRTPINIKYKGGKNKNAVRKIVPFSLLPLPMELLCMENVRRQISSNITKLKRLQK